MPQLLEGSYSFNVMYTIAPFTFSTCLDFLYSKWRSKALHRLLPVTHQICEVTFRDNMVITYFRYSQGEVKCLYQ